MKQRPTARGYALPLGDGVTAHAHPDGGLTFEAGDGRAFDLSPAAALVLADLIGLSGQLRAAARRRRAQETYAERWEGDQ